MRRFGDVDGEATSIAYTGGADASGPRAVARARASGTQAAPPGTGRGARLTIGRARYPQRLDPGSALGRAVVDRAVVHVADVRDTTEFPALRAVAEATGRGRSQGARPSFALLHSAL